MMENSVQPADCGVVRGVVHRLLARSSLGAYFSGLGSLFIKSHPWRPQSSSNSRAVQSVVSGDVTSQSSVLKTRLFQFPLFGGGQKLLRCQCLTLTSCDVFSLKTEGEVGVQGWLPDSSWCLGRHTQTDTHPPTAALRAARPLKSAAVIPSFLSPLL